MGLAKLVGDGEISAAELCEEAIRRAEGLNPKLNAIVTPLYAYARETDAQSRPGAPFSGVPFLLKDAHHALKGFAMSSGSKLLKDVVSSHEAEIVTRFKKAGLVILGKTNTPEFKLAYVTEPDAFGPTRNPWNLNYTPGGSSGGSAAAVAAGIVPFASATDEGGSIRVPASCCGLFGLKPSRGRNPVGPDFDEAWDGMSTSHVITRSVRDSAAILDAVCGPESGAPYGLSPPETSFFNAINIEPEPLRVCFHTPSAYGEKIHPECQKALERTCKLLEGLGHHVEESAPVYQEEEAALNWCIVMIANAAALVDKLVGVYGQATVRRDIELSNYALYSIGRRLKALDLVNAKRRWRQLGALMDKRLKKYDLMLTPTLGKPPVAVGSQHPGKADQRAMKLIRSWAGRIILSNRKLTFSTLETFIQKTMRGQLPFTIIANMTGQPAMSVPLHWTQDGLPCGVQFIGPMGGEARLLRLAAQLEKAQPWSGRKPQMLQ